MSIPTFITSIEKLLNHTDSQVFISLIIFRITSLTLIQQIRKRALVILNAKLAEARSTLNTNEAKLFVGLTSNLTKIVSVGEV